MIHVANSIREIDCSTGRLPLDELLSTGEPAVLRGIAKQWGLVEAGLCSDRDAMSYLRSFYNGKPIEYSFGEPGIKGRPFYNAGFTELNCVVRRERLDDVLTQIETHLNDEQPPTYYVASLLIEGCLPGLRADNDLDLKSNGVDAPPSIWIGNRTIASCHYDAPNNIAVCAVGRRRFTIFPAEQISNLYPGPLELTPGGQAVSVVDFGNPDFDRHPRFREALMAGFAAEVGAGDAVFIPSMWWHHVQGLSAFNTLINYWWNSSPNFIPTPMHALYHAMWTIRDRPEREREAWKHVFEYYVFGSADKAAEHLPEGSRGILDEIDDTKARQIRSMLINKLNR
jgi:Cupin-like domain